MEKKTILLIDDYDTRKSLKTFLKRHLFWVIEAQTGNEALSKIKNDDVDFVLLELKLPDMYGVDLCRTIRQMKPNLPIIFLTYNIDVIETVLCFASGADDYIQKPFNNNILLARIKANFRQTKQKKVFRSNRYSNFKIDDYISIKFGNWKYYPKKSTFTYSNSSETYLTEKENSLLKLLLSNPNSIFDRNAIAEYLHIISQYDVGQDVNIHVHRLRTKLTQGHNASSPIKSVRSKGYTLDSYLNYCYDDQEVSCL